MLVAAKVTSSVSANHREPLCYTPFSQVTPLHYPPSLRSRLRPPGGAKAGELARVTIGSGSLPWGGELHVDPHRPEATTSLERTVAVALLLDSRDWFTKAEPILDGVRGHSGTSGEA